MTEDNPGSIESDTEWNARYGARGTVLQHALTAAIRESLADDRELLDARIMLRDRRATFEPRFCLLLYGAAPDEALMSQLMSELENPLPQDEVRRATASIGRPGRNSQIMTLLMVLLDHELELHLAMLERQTDAPVEGLQGPVRIQAPEQFWFVMFGLVAELAQAILVVGNIGANLLQEIRYLSGAGLSRRILLYADTHLHTCASDDGIDEHTWDLSSEGLRAAIAYAASTVAEPPEQPT